jgi:GntR family transcriptional regulator
MLEKTNIIPLYVQLQRIIKEMILKGEYKEGDLLPSESAMMKKFQTTRGTVRKAISELVKEGLVYQEQGKGSFVCFREVQYSMFNFGGFTDYLKTQNETPVSKVLESRIIDLDGKDYYKLIRSRGVRKEGHIKFLTIDTSIIPSYLFPDIEKHDFSVESLYQVMRENYSIFPKFAEITLEPTIVDEEIRNILQVHDKGVTFLRAQGSVLNDQNIEIEKTSVIYSPNIKFKLMTSIR